MNRRILLVAHPRRPEALTVAKGVIDRLTHVGIEVSLFIDPEAAQIVERVNDGNQTVPTMVYSDGSAQTNPSLAQVKAKLASLN